MSPTGVYEHKPHPKVPCSIAGCETVSKSLGMCEKHYYRVRRTGSSDVRPPLLPRVREVEWHKRRAHEECIVPDCKKLDAGSNGYCSMHLARVRRHGDPNVKLAPGEPGGPGSERRARSVPGYSAAHMRVRADRGSANLYVCRCGSPAKQWSYDHRDQNELNSKLGPYSADSSHYVPLCVPCHKRDDLEFLAQKRKSA